MVTVAAAPTQICTASALRKGSVMVIVEVSVISAMGDPAFTRSPFATWTVWTTPAALAVGVRFFTSVS